MGRPLYTKPTLSNYNEISKYINDIDVTLPIDICESESTPCEPCVGECESNEGCCFLIALTNDSVYDSGGPPLSASDGYSLMPHPDYPDEGFGAHLLYKKATCAEFGSVNELVTVQHPKGPRTYETGLASGVCCNGQCFPLSCPPVDS